MKKILIFSLAYYPSHVSGAEVAIKEISDRISPESIQFHMLTLRFDPSALREEQIGNVFVHRIGVGGAYLSKIFFVPLAALAAVRLHVKHRFDAAWTMMTYMLFPLTIARMLGFRIPYIVTLQDGDPYERVFERWFIKLVSPILDSGFRDASIIQAISQYLAEWPVRRGYKGVVVVVPNGASIPSAQDYPESELEEVRRSLNMKEGEVVLLSVARLVHQKAQDVVIRALPLLPSHIRYVVVGEGENREMLESLAKELGVAERVTFTGQVDRTMTAKYRKVSDVFVLPSRSEGQGISFLSTMVSGLPMVATQAGGIAEFLFDKKRNPDKPPTGWAVDIDNYQQIAEAVEDIRAHPEEAARVAKNAKKLAHEKYSWDPIVEDMQARVFGRVLGKL